MDKRSADVFRACRLHLHHWLLRCATRAYVAAHTSTAKRRPTASKARSSADGWPEPLPLETFGPLSAPTRRRPPVAD